MTVPTRPQWMVLAAISALFVLAGCDPGGPGASGTVSLDPAVDVTGALTLELAAFPDPGDGYDPYTPLPEAGELYRRSLDLLDIEFPCDYLIGGGVGTTDSRQWRLLAWLSTAEEPEGLDPGEWFGTTTFTIKKCGSFFGGYCGVRGGVDLTIDTLLQ